MLASAERRAAKRATNDGVRDVFPRPPRLEAPAEDWQQGRKVRWHVADAVLAIAVLGAVVTLGNLDHMPHGMQAFLAIRLSVKNLLLLGAFAAAWPAVMMACGLYSPGRLRSGDGEWLRLLLAGAVACALAMVFPLTSRSGMVGPWHALAFGIAVVPAAGLLRATVRTVDRRVSRARPRHVVIVGSGPIAGRMYDQLLSDPLQNITIVGFVDTEPRAPLAGNGAGHLGRVEDLERILMHRVVDDVLIGLPVKSRYDEIQHSIAACARVGVPASYSVDLFGGSRVRPGDLGRTAPVLSLSHAAELRSCWRSSERWTSSAPWCCWSCFRR